jgi:hypothetical protein
MDQETQQRRTLNLVKTVLKRALALPLAVPIHQSLLQ